MHRGQLEWIYLLQDIGNKRVINMTPIKKVTLLRKMGQVPKLIIIILLFSSICQGSPIPSQDTMLLYELVSNSIREINELEQLVSNQQKYTKRIQEYNELAEDYKYKLEYVDSLIEDIHYLSKEDIKDLSDLNEKIRSLKYKRDQIADLVKDYATVEVKNEKNPRSNKNKKKMASNDRKVITKYSDCDFGGCTRKAVDRQNLRINKVNARNNIQANENTLIISEKVTETNNLLAKKQKNEAINKLQKERFYNIHPEVKKLHESKERPAWSKRQ